MRWCKPGAYSVADHDSNTEAVYTQTDHVCMHLWLDGLFVL